MDDASNGAEAFDKMQTKQYGLVISDWNMKPVTGYELLKRMRASDAHADIPFIMVTAGSKPENITAARRAGVNNYLIKPFNQQSLKSKIDQVFDDAKTAAA